MEKALSAGIRYAPSPTGRFHVGNLRTAWISHQWARRLGQPWIVRFEDIDLPRVMPGAQVQQLVDLEALGLKPDQLHVQSEAHERHRATFERAVGEGRIYPCFCSRKDVREALEHAASAPHPAPGLPPPGYSGRCRNLGRRPTAADHGLPSLAWRFAVKEDPSGRADFIVGRSSPQIDARGLPAEWRSFAPAYHWACAVDDLDGGYALLVRAWDLSPVVPLQRAIMRWLARSEGSAATLPAVYHTALITQNDGHRLEKRTRGVTLPALLEAGWTVARLQEAFERSWSEKAPWEASKVFGESRETMSLAELGIH